MAVTGYTVPVPQPLLDLYSWDVYFLPRIGSWGWGTWGRAWKHYERDISVAHEKALSLGVDLAQCGSDVKGYIEGQLEQGRDIWTPNWMLTLYLRGACCVYPTVTHVQNVGHDGTGTQCRVTKKYDVEVATELGTRLLDWPVVSQAMMDNYREVYP